MFCKNTFSRICEALNFNNPSPKVYSNMREFWDTKRDCQTPWLNFKHRQPGQPLLSSMEITRS